MSRRPPPSRHWLRDRRPLRLTPTGTLLTGGRYRLDYEAQLYANTAASVTNADGTTDLVDLHNALKNIGTTGAPNEGDANGDWLVDLTDLNDVLDNFVRHRSARFRLLPEPTTLLLFIISPFSSSGGHAARSSLLTPRLPKTTYSNGRKAPTTSRRLLLSQLTKLDHARPSGTPLASASSRLHTGTNTPF